MSSPQPKKPVNMDPVVREILDEIAASDGTGQTRLVMFRKARGFAAELIGHHSIPCVMERMA
ncbi:hypothetical protein [Methylococcus sp. EFPC2]|uniref:hypothetical protein n=1 Tax=Methylococcus sp. EFPC2 TaxID=2812648 RepID=UPI00196895F5|nr:hypothetical protein [Methylococcus sp. EFPC2]QSA97507.1 hypothetical protein JWZ97_01265 [Methylococcus sp. EFPC2]